MWICQMPSWVNAFFFNAFNTSTAHSVARTLVRDSLRRTDQFEPKKMCSNFQWLLQLFSRYLLRAQSAAGCRCEVHESVD